MASIALNKHDLAIPADYNQKSLERRQRLMGGPAPRVPIIIPPRNSPELITLSDAPDDAQLLQFSQPERKAKRPSRKKPEPPKPGFVLIEEAQLIRLQTQASRQQEVDDAEASSDAGADREHALKTHRLRDFGDLRIVEILEYVRRVRMPEKTVDYIISALRQQSLVKVRFEMAYLCREAGRMSLPKIGQRMGGRDHTTILHAARKHAERLAKGEVEPLPFDKRIAASVRLDWLKANYQSEYNRVMDAGELTPTA